MKINSQRFSFHKDTPLKDWQTQVELLYTSKENYKDILKKLVTEISRLQDILYAQNHYALLLIIQGMDTAGKDGLIKHVLSGLNPQGCQVFSFKQPSQKELQHDFLWRTTLDLPERGHIGVFNRSYYEEVLIVKVHPNLLEKQMLPPEVLNKKSFWNNRYHSINEFEKHLYQNGTQIIKFFLNLSNEEQRRRFLQRIDSPNKNWKMSMTDIEERKLWPKYMSAYEECLVATSTTLAPWYVIPADDKENARLIAAQIILEALQNLKLSYPHSEKNHEELEKIRKLLN